MSKKWGFPFKENKPIDNEFTEESKELKKDETDIEGVSEEVIDEVVENNLEDLAGGVETSFPESLDDVSLDEGRESPQEDDYPAREILPNPDEPESAVFNGILVVESEPEPEPEPLKMEFTGDVARLLTHLINEIRSFVGEKKVVLGLSGGVDSAVCAALCRRALGFQRTICVFMPYGGKDGDRSLTSRLAEKLMLQKQFVNIRPAVDAAVASIKITYPRTPEMNKKIIGNIKARERMKVLYAIANMHDNAFVVGTGNKTEIYLGYSTKHGDAAADFFPLGDCLKCDVRALASHLMVLQEIIDRPPSAELWEGQTDEGELGMTYNQLDALVETYVRAGVTSDLMPNDPEVLKNFGIDPIEAAGIFQRIIDSEHKRILAPVFSVARFIGRLV